MFRLLFFHDYRLRPLQKHFEGEFLFIRIPSLPTDEPKDTRVETVIELENRIKVNIVGVGAKR